jgi:uncharacterized protein YbaP (TraB family)
MRSWKVGIALLLTLTLLCACSKSGGEKKDEPGGCLWRIKTPANTVYLQGSVHFLKKENYPLPGPIEKAYADSQVLVLEIDLGVMEDPSSQQFILEKGLLPKGVTLKDKISAETYAFAKEQIETLGLPIEMFHSFKPWVTSLQLLGVKLDQMGFRQRFGVDFHFYTRAKREGKEIVGLETVEFQFGLFDSMSDSDQENMLRQTLEDMAKVEQEIDKMVQAWATGDLQSMDALLVEEFKKYPNLYQAVFVDRNRNWISSIESFLNTDKNYLIVVGAGHLAGKDGVLALLENKGHNVEKL